MQKVVVLYLQFYHKPDVKKTNSSILYETKIQLKS